MRLTIFCYLLLVATLLLDSPPLRREAVSKSRDRFEALQAIRACHGLDLAKRPDGEVWTLVGQIEKLLPPRSDPADHRLIYTPLRVWYAPVAGRSECLLFEKRTLEYHPGYSLILITALNSSGERISEDVLLTGWRGYLRDLKLAAVADNDFPLLTLETKFQDGTHQGRQFYARVGDKYELVRVEDEEGVASRNCYFVRHDRCGPAVPRRTESEWATDLNSADRYRVLRTLVWLGGRHMKLRLGEQPGKQYEQPEEAELVHRVRARSGVLEQLKALSRSEDRWLREGAQLAADPNDGWIDD